MATDRNENFYEGAVDKRELGKDQPMTTNSMMAIFSTTKALTGVCLMQLVEEASVARKKRSALGGPSSRDLIRSHRSPFADDRSKILISASLAVGNTAKFQPLMPLEEAGS